MYFKNRILDGKISAIILSIMFIIYNHLSSFLSVRNGTRIHVGFCAFFTFLGGYRSETKESIYD